jgi:threonine dehydratase
MTVNDPEAAAAARPTFRDVLRARRVIRRHLRPTPLFGYPALSDLVGLDLLVKHENHQPIGAFKLRGGVYLMSCLSDEERNRGVIAASTGNHGQSIAWASRLFGATATIGVPDGANQGKVDAMRALGAEVVFHGRDYEECRLFVERLALERGLRYVHSGDEPLLIAGVGTAALEIFESDPNVGVLLVPVGGGSGAAAACIVAKAIDPRIQVIGVQAAAAPAVFESWRGHRRITTESADTFAEGLATRSSFELPLGILWDMLDDFVLVSDEEMEGAIRLLLQTTHNLAEGAGAAALAAAIKMRAQLAGQRVAMVLSGGNLSLDQLRHVIAAD